MNNSGKNRIVLNEVESTNNYANHLIVSKEAEEGTVVLAHYQKKGRGQRGNYWESEAKMNLLASIILFPEFLPAEKQFFISKIVSLAICEFLTTKTGDVTIKWPNDIYVGNKKIAGILIENAVKGKCLFSSVLGIGLNLNQEVFVSDTPNPVSLKQLTGGTYNIEQVLDEICILISAGYEKLKSGDFGTINSDYFSNLFRKETWSKYKKGETEFEARIKGIGEYGQLILEERNGNISAFMFKEVEFVI
jgi:BirA family biotin operon repressor/biotin-[acetyl-CoA-carboxylase] ligase